jgi:hypothetical protein
MASNLESVLDRGSLRRIAGARSFERGEEYFADGQVGALVVQKGTIAAKVQGTRPLRKTHSTFIPYADMGVERDESWRSIDWEEEKLRKLLRGLRWEDKALLKLLAEAGGAMRQARIMAGLPNLRGKPASLRALKSHVNAACKGHGNAPILSVGTGSGNQRIHEINQQLGPLRAVVIEEAKAFSIPDGVL